MYDFGNQMRISIVCVKAYTISLEDNENLCDQLCGDFLSSCT